MIKVVITFYIIIVSLTYSCKADDSSDSSSSYGTSENDEADGCRFDDGTHSATVDYYNPETEYSQTYTLEVEVENCELIQINFPKGGWLDSDHITPAELDEDGTCTVEGEDGKTYEIQIEK